MSINWGEFLNGNIKDNKKEGKWRKLYNKGMKAEYTIGGEEI